MQLLIEQLSTLVLDFVEEPVPQAVFLHEAQDLIRRSGLFPQGAWFNTAPYEPNRVRIRVQEILLAAALPL